MSFYAVLPIYAIAMGRVWARKASLRAEALGVGLIILAAFPMRSPPQRGARTS